MENSLGAVVGRNQLGGPAMMQTRLHGACTAGGSEGAVSEAGGVHAV